MIQNDLILGKYEEDVKILNELKVVQKKEFEQDLIINYTGVIRSSSLN